MEKYNPNARVDNPAVIGWASGKLIEAALAKVFAKARSGPITPALVVEGLNKVSGERLNGLVPAPITFGPGGKLNPLHCTHAVLIDERGFTAPNDARPQFL